MWVIFDKFNRHYDGSIHMAKEIGLSILKSNKENLDNYDIKNIKEELEFANLDFKEFADKINDMVYSTNSKIYKIFPIQKNVVLHITTVEFDTKSIAAYAIINLDNIPEQIIFDKTLKEVKALEGFCLKSLESFDAKLIFNLFDYSKG